MADLQNPSIEIGVHDTPYNRYYFKVETEPIRKHLYDTKIAPSNGPSTFMNKTEGILKVREGMFAFHIESSPGYREIEATFFEKEKCGLVEIKFFGNVDPWCVIQKHSPYKEILKVRQVSKKMLMSHKCSVLFFFIHIYELQRSENSRAWYPIERKSSRNDRETQM